MGIVMTTLKRTLLREEKQTMHMVMETVIRMVVVHREEQTVLVMIVIIKPMSPLSQPPSLLPALL
jgi:hypothetical protein